jgi:hypothetical protein
MLTCDKKVDPLLPSPTLERPAKVQEFKIDSRKFGRLLLLFTFFIWTSLKLATEAPRFYDTLPFWKDDDSSACAQADALVPDQNGNLWNALAETYGTDAFKNRAVDWLGGAVRIP